MASAVSRLPIRYTSYTVVCIPYKNSPSVQFPMQCPYDKVEEFITSIFGMPLEEVFFFRVKGSLADGSLHHVLGDDTAVTPSGQYNIRHAGLISPGTVGADKMKEAFASYHTRETERVAKATSGHCITATQWAEIQAKRLEGKTTTNRRPAVVAGPPTPLIPATPEPNYDYFPVVATTSIEIEVFK